MKEVIVQYGGVSLNRLCQQLKENQIHLNAYANQLLRHPQLSLSADKQRAACVIVPLKELGLPQGGSLTEIFAAAPSYGLTCCTLEMALHFRLSYRQLANSTGLKSQGKAPAAAITIASVPLEKTDDFPKGFYVRRIDGVDWLRGYTCDARHQFAPDDLFWFNDETRCQSASTEGETNRFISNVLVSHCLQSFRRLRRAEKDKRRNR